MECKGKEISKNEVTSIALHLINNQSVKSMTETMNDIEEINTIINIIEYKSNKKLDKKSLDYSRFIFHLRFLLNRFKEKEYYSYGASLDLIDELKKYGIEPLVTISHYEMLIYLTEHYNGWLNKNLIGLFEK